MQPGLAALLAHDAIGAPGGEGVVESFVCGSDRLFAGVRHSHLIEAGEITQSEIAVRGHDPRIAAVAQGVREAVIILKQKNRLGAQAGGHRAPIDGIRKIDVKVGDDRLAALLHIGRRRKISLLEILQLGNQRLLR